MKRPLAWAFLVLLGTTLVAWGAAPPPSKSAALLKDLQRNLALGSALTHRAPTAAEQALIRKQAEQGEQGARGLVAANPASADAQYALGSWLLYGYRVVSAEQAFTDAQGVERSRPTPSVVQGLGDTPQEGLEALLEAHQLAPNNGRYFLDYGAALLDSDRSREALSVLKKVWLGAGKLKLSSADKAHTALLLSDATANLGDPQGAREWLYRALGMDPRNAGYVQRLEHLDQMDAEARRPRGNQPEDFAPPEEEGPPELEAPPSDTEDQPEEIAPSDTEDQPEEVAPSDTEDQPEEVAPPAEDQQPDEAAPSDSTPTTVPSEEDTVPEDTGSE